MEEKVTQAPVKPTITMEELQKVDIRVGTILKVEDLPRSDKVSVLTVDFGDHERTILAGIREERDNPREIEGLQALFVVNLPSRKISGVVSQGMLYDIGYEDGIKPALAVPERKVPEGTRLG